MNRNGILTVISGFSGAGKGTLIRELVKKPDYRLSISATTRLPREGEQNGREYFFLTKEEFEGMIKNNQLIEYAEYVGNYYGTPQEYVEEQLKMGYNVILEIEVQGAMKVKEKYPDALFLFVTPPSAAVLRERLVNRGTEDKETVQRRLSQAADEVDYMDKYDYLIVNDNLADCVEQMHRIISEQKNKIKYNQNFIHLIGKDLEGFKKGDR
ncbi:guanylate kinase [Anaeromicropila populeti]|uniref:Guanylate kinase n=1 Tax=Anaeromicropila populeti TaxID=37658 RepID=A0A1I6KWY4_9FIRM|nr:guanylate kinase [Anaeromicropila populeti]SFR95518.1 guanylate kinase [Anaeromicropila populeti]